MLKCLAARSVQWTEGAAEGELSQNTVLMCLEDQEPNLQQEEAKVGKACLGKDGSSNCFVLSVLTINDAPARDDLPLGTQRCTYRATIVGTQLSSLRLQRRAASTMSKCDRRVQE